jgi:hypothetical protein
MNKIITTRTDIVDTLDVDTVDVTVGAAERGVAAGDSGLGRDGLD